MVSPSMISPTIVSPYGYDSEVLDAIRMFHFALQDVPKNIEEELSPLTDSGRAKLLREVLDTRRISFAEWDYDEVCVFLMLTYAKPMFRECCQCAGGSKFMNLVYKNWQPSFELHAFTMWEYSKRDSVLFGHWLYLLPSEQQPSKQDMGKVLFSTMVTSGMLTENDCASVTGALLLYPLESMYAREHEQEIDKYSMLLEPEEVGLICRSLFLHRAIERSSCRCNYRDPSNSLNRCQCGDGSMEHNSSSIKLSNDLDKEYASAIFQLVLERHHQSAVAFNRRWSQKSRDEFLRSACERIFCKEVYTEIYQNLHSGKKPTVQQRNPRPLTVVEIRTNVARSADLDYDPSFANHNGCVVRSCPQSTKKECSNVSCKTHCHGLGFKNCNAHRMYTPHPGPSYQPRRGIDFIPEHTRSAGRDLPAVREGNI
ncbi:hypothetical protein FGB62_16g158 [Gracilaria domingensis]|nr:hypothetical protein FGB62_16g158 [Gracilaria domingensis]